MAGRCRAIMRRISLDRGTTLTVAARSNLHNAEALPSDEQLERIEKGAIAAAREAGAYVSHRFGGRLDIEHKDDPGKTLVTDADRESQALIAKFVQEQFPDHLVLGEEDPPEQDPPAPDFVWAVDPVDGTTNFANGLPIYAVSVAVLHRGRPVVAACWAPWTTEQGFALFHARLGGGAFLDDAPIHVKAPSDGRLPDRRRIALVPSGISFGYHIGKELRAHPGEARVTGSIVYELALVATGISQYAVTGHASIWDYAAATLLVREAGGKVLTPLRDAQGRLHRSWVPLDTFVGTYANAPSTFRAMRDWRGPVIAGAPSVVDFVAANLRLRRRSWVRKLRRAVQARLNGKK